MAGNTVVERVSGIRWREWCAAMCNTNVLQQCTRFDHMHGLEGGDSVRFLTVTQVRASSARIWKQLFREGPIIITANGKPVALLSPISEDTIELELASLSRARAELALEAIHQASIEQGTHQQTDETIEGEIQAVRRGRRGL